MIAHVMAAISSSSRRRREKDRQERAKETKALNDALVVCRSCGYYFPGIPGECCPKCHSDIGMQQER